jgi:gamma-glutamylputrescine oxidase
VQVPRAALPARTEFAVVGAGFAGLAAAAALARAGGDVHVFEASSVGDGASGRSGGLALEDTAMGKLEGVEGCLDALRDAVRDYAIECHLDLRGCFEVRHRDPSDGASSPGSGWPDVADGELVVARRVPGGGVDAGALVAGLARAALAAGATIHEHARVDAWEAGPPIRLRTREASVEAARVLLAVDALPPALLRPAGFRAALTLALATEPLPAATLEAVGLGATPFYTVDLPYLWGRATRDGRLVIGSGLAFDPDGELERVSVERDDVAEMFARVERRLRGLHPALAEVAVTHRWGGPIGFRAGAAPILAEVAPGVIAAGAYAGHGVALSVRVGGLASRWLRGDGAPPAWGADR